jgi:hypothetical protein
MGFFMKVTVIFVRFSWNLNFLEKFFEKYKKISNFMKIRQWDRKFSIRTDRKQADKRDKANRRFSQFYESA